MSNDSLGDRMKMYEGKLRLSLIPKIPVILRLDGKAFHSLTSRFCEKPYDRRFQESMWAAAKHLCASIQGTQFAYVQSDEISLLLIDYQSIHTQGWFEYDLQKMISVSASIATVAFYKEFCQRYPGAEAMPNFDSRGFNLVRDEICNYFIWRQQDAVRNSINSLGQNHFSPKQLHGKNTDQVQELLWQEKKINWNDCQTEQKRGVCLVKKSKQVAINLPNQKADPANPTFVNRTYWDVDTEIPTFTQDRNYVDKYVVSPL